MDRMRVAALLASLAVLAAYPLLMTRIPGFTWSSPRGGMAMQALSLLFANAAIWQARNGHLAPATRFQMVAAGWIWILVQAGASLYMYIAAG